MALANASGIGTRMPAAGPQIPAVGRSGALPTPAQLSVNTHYRRDVINPHSEVAAGVDTPAVREGVWGA